MTPALVLLLLYLANLLILSLSVYSDLTGLSCSSMQCNGSCRAVVAGGCCAKDALQHMLVAEWPNNMRDASSLFIDRLVSVGIIL